MDRVEELREQVRRERERTDELLRQSEDLVKKVKNTMEKIVRETAPDSREQSSK